MESLDKEQARVLQEISLINTMRKGSINSQKNKAVRKDGSVAEYGPYSTLTYKDADGKTHTESIAAGDLDFYRSEIEKYRRFQELSAEYVRISEEKSRLTTQMTLDEQAKKNRKS
jgi:hypothetical protein